MFKTTYAYCSSSINETIKVVLPRLIIDAPYESHFMASVDFFIGGLFFWPLSRGYFDSSGHALWPLPFERGGCCREVKTRASVWIIRRDKKINCRSGEVTAKGGSTVQQKTPEVIFNIRP